MTKRIVSDSSPAVNAGEENIEKIIATAINAVAYERKGNPKYPWIRTSTGEYMKGTTEEATALLDSIQPGLAPSREAFIVDMVLDRCMCRAGKRLLDHKTRALILRDAVHVRPEPCILETPAAVEHALRQEILGQLFFDWLSIGAEQAQRLMVFIYNAFRRLDQWEHLKSVELFIPALCLLGAQGAGKTLIITLLARLLGGASDISAYMRGESAFVPDITSTPVLFADDAREDLTLFQRRALMTAIKALLASEGFGINRKNRESLTMKLPWCVTIAGNTAQCLPLAESGDEHKLLALWFKEPADIDELRRGAIGEAMRDRAALARFAGLCVRYGQLASTDSKSDLVDHSGRQICAGWIAPDVQNALDEIAPAEVVGDSILAALRDWPQDSAHGNLAAGVSMRCLRQQALRSSPGHLARKLPSTEAGFKRLAEIWLEQQGVQPSKDTHQNVVYKLAELRTSLFR